MRPGWTRVNEDLWQRVDGARVRRLDNRRMPGIVRWVARGPGEEDWLMADGERLWKFLDAAPAMGNVDRVWPMGKGDAES